MTARQVAQHIFALLNNPLTPANLWEYIAQFVAEQTSGDFSERLLHSAATLDQLLQGMKPKEFIGERASMTN